MERVTGLSGLSGSHPPWDKASASEHSGPGERIALAPMLALLLAVGVIVATLVFYVERRVRAT